MSVSLAQADVMQSEEWFQDELIATMALYLLVRKLKGFQRLMASDIRDVN